MIEIITVTKNDYYGLVNTVLSTESLRMAKSTHQTIIDGSSNHQSRLIQKFILGKEGISYYYQEPKGIAQAFNYGIKKTNKKWIWFLNGGDMCKQGMNIELFISLFKKTSADMVIFETKNRQNIIKRPPMYLMWPPFPVWIPHPSTIIRRSLLVDNYGFNEKYKIAMDAEFWLRVLSKDAVADIISIPIVKFTTGGVSSDLVNLSAEGKYIIQKNISLILKLWLKNLLNIIYIYCKFWKISRKK